jgi:Extended Signal Peptide of Type V secretion system
LLSSHSHFGNFYSFYESLRMNAVYKSIWNESLGAWVATAENTAARGKKGSSKKALAMPVVQAVAAAAALVFAAPSWATAILDCVADASVINPASGTVNCSEPDYTSIYVNAPNDSVEVNLTQPNATVNAQYNAAIAVIGRQ